MSAENNCHKKHLNEQLKIIETKIKESHREQQEYEETMAVQSIEKKYKYFYTYGKKKMKSRTQIDPLERDGQLLESRIEMAEVLRGQYESVFSQPT